MFCRPLNSDDALDGVGFEEDEELAVLVPVLLLPCEA